MLTLIGSSGDIGSLAQASEVPVPAPLLALIERRGHVLLQRAQLAVNCRAHALAQLSAQPAETWMIGDHLEWEVAAPQRLGIHSIWVDVAGAGVPEGSPVRPDRIIRALPELLIDA